MDALTRIEELKKLKVSNNINLNGNGKHENKFDTSKYRITSQSNIPDIQPIITIAGSIFAIKGDISFVAGLPKAGKSAISSFMIATGLIQQIPEHLDTLQIKTEYCFNKPIIYIDTEQPRAYTKKMIRTISKLIGEKDIPSNFYIFNLRELKPEDKLNFIRQLFKDYSETHLWIIDGIADLVSDVNNTEISNNLLHEFSAKSQELDTAMILYLHENPGSNKMRGHLGSEAERKCGGAINVVKYREKGYHEIQARMLRGSKDFEPVCFRYSEEFERMVSMDANEIKTIQKESEEDKKNRLYQVAQRCFLTSTSLGASQLIRGLCLYGDPRKGEISESSAQKLRKDLLEYGIIENGEKRSYTFLTKK